MISCPNCGGLNPKGSQICGACGTPLINNQSNTDMASNQQETNNINNQSSFDNTSALNNQQSQYQDVQNVQQDIAQSNNAIDDNVLINAYIGNNSDALKNGSFSWCTLFFEGIYIWYRKMYSLLAIWFLLMLGLNIGGTFFRYLVIANSSSLISLSSNLKIFNAMFKVIDLIVILIIAFNFKNLYLKHVKEKVLVIKNENPNSTESELVQICQKKGGTTAVPIVITIVLVIASFVIVLLTTFRTTTKYVDNSKKIAMSDKGLLAVEAVRSNIVENGMSGESKIYDIDAINNLVEVKFDKSPFGKEYKDVKVQVIKTNRNYLYKVCLIDSGHNGFGFVDSSNLSYNSVLVGKAPSRCQ